MKVSIWSVLLIFGANNPLVFAESEAPVEEAAAPEAPMKLEIPEIVDAIFGETFQALEDFASSQWVSSEHDKYANQLMNIRSLESMLAPFNQDTKLVLEKEAQHYALSSSISPPMQFDMSKPSQHEMVFQYEVRLENGLDCGGAYIKLLEAHDDLATVYNDSPYVIMFGPDKCGSNNKVHLIFRHENPVTKKVEEKHLENPPEAPIDTKTHLYSLYLNTKNDSYSISIDQTKVREGSVYEHFSPGFIPPRKIPDPAQTKPKDWVDEKEIPDSNAEKPDDWDEDEPAEIEDLDAVKPEGWLDNEPDEIPDPEAEKPEDWDDEADGEYEANMVPNPKCEEAPGCGKWVRPTKPNPAYKGKWIRPMIPNPAYKGEWEADKIDNPAYFEQTHILSTLKPIAAVAIEVWTMSSGIAFDNFWFGYDVAAATKFADQTFGVLHASEMKQQKEKDEAQEEETQVSMVTKAQVFITELYRVFMEDLGPVPQLGLFLGALLVTYLLYTKCCGRRRRAQAPEKKLDDEQVEPAAAASEAEPKAETLRRRQPVVEAEE